ncbi:exodeoxyribonuclease V subunit gamma [Nocardioides alcanivorans]|uniref:exodeoxyribonuclease V subunit gamma n=1 Tax=Nocardioides alcanivorans TaxID=2897352 RepID=UPI001F375819|nr:exodeoxyribonuclease V subunit gamma [Nocardioides alcanivorans]
MALLLHRAERTDRLADGLAEVLRTPLADPFADEVVAVPARGVERWLGQRLSHRLGVGARGGDGVCAGVRFVSPHSLVSMLLDRDRDDPWDPDRLVWPLLAAIDEAMGEPWAHTLATHLGHGLEGPEAEVRSNRRYSVARRLAGLLAAAAGQRPDMLVGWERGDETDGAGRVLPDDLAWQPELWRRVVDRVRAPSPGVRLSDTLERLARGGDALDLPGRLSLFGHTRLTRSEVRIIGALARVRDVHLWLPQPSLALWEQLGELSAAGPVPRRDDHSAESVQNPVLASLGRDSRELQRTLAEAGEIHDHALPLADEAPQTLLGRLQADIRANRAPRPGPVVEGDDSFQVHSCHGPSRQVEVLREVLVGLLADDRDLEPRDVLVMCPDIETYAPLIQAGFGLGEIADEGHPAHRLRVRLADRSLAATNPLLAVAARLVELAGGRVTATDVLDLLANPAVAERFRLQTDDHSRIARWIADAGVRWGIDAAARADYHLDRFGQNTWRAGIDRLLLGVAMADDDHGRLGVALPLDDVSSGDIDLVGKVTEYVDRIAAALEALQTAHAVEQWAAALGEAVSALTKVPADRAWQATQFERELATIRQAAASGTTALRLTDVRSLLQHRLAGRPTRANFRTGTLTVSTMVPMRSVPHKVICLVGLDDGAFPRVGTIDGDDLLGRDPLTGERDLRSEDRQLLLDAVLAATEKLVITYSGANEHTGSERPPAVPVGELLDAAELTAPEAQVRIDHPLQSFDRRNLVPGLVPGSDRPFSFDAAALAGARVAVRDRVQRPPLLTDPLPALPAGDVSLDELIGFHTHPVREFLRHRLDVTTPLEAELAEVAIPIELDALATWGIGDRLLRAVLEGRDPSASMFAEQLRGFLPPGQLGVRTLREVTTKVQEIVTSTHGLRAEEARTVDVDIDLGGGRRLTGTVTDVRGHQRLVVGYSGVRARQRLDNWINLLALSAGHPDQHWTAMVVGKGKGAPARSLAGPVDHRAVEWLRTLVEIRDRGLCAPLPLPLRTGMAWAEARARADSGAPADPEVSARREWETDRNRGNAPSGDQDDPFHKLVWGDAAPFERLTAPVVPDEPEADSVHRLDQLSRQVWGPLLVQGLGRWVRCDRTERW